MFYICTTKKKIASVLLVTFLSAVLVIAVALGYGNAAAAEIEGPVGDTKKARIEYLKSLGYTPDESYAETQKQVEIPFVFSDVYEGYNAMQKKAGFDLSRHSGKKPTLYTLKLKYEGRDDVFCNLLVFKGKIIGGDITATDVETGFMYPLVKKE